MGKKAMVKKVPLVHFQSSSLHPDLPVHLKWHPHCLLFPFPHHPPTMLVTEAQHNTVASTETGQNSNYMIRLKWQDSKNVDGYWCGSSGGEVIGTRDKSLSGWRRWCTSGSRSSCCFLNTLALILSRYFRCSKLKSIFLTVSPNVNG